MKLLESFVLFAALKVSSAVGLPPVFNKQPVGYEILFKSSLNSDKNKPFEVPCEAAGDPPPDYRWLKDGKFFNISSHSDQISQSIGSGTLSFLKPSKENEGDYVCLAENKFGTASSNAVSLKRAFLDNFKNDSVQIIEAIEGESFKLECRAPNGYPKPSVSWMMQTIQGAIKSVDNPRVTMDPVGNLWFTSLTREDSSKESYYVCSAASSFVNEYKLGNRVMLKINPRKRTSLNGSAPTRQYVSSPSVTVLRGKTVELLCIYEGSPPPTIAWSKNGKQVVYDERIMSTNDGKILKIKYADGEDEADYTCVASSEIGDDGESKFRLTVESAPCFIKAPDSKNVTRPAELEIDCLVDGVPEPKVTWHFNGKEIENSHARRKLSATKIVIKSVELSDTGNYKCHAANRHGFISRDVYVRVQD